MMDIPYQCLKESAHETHKQRETMREIERKTERMRERHTHRMRD